MKSLVLFSVFIAVAIFLIVNQTINAQHGRLEKANWGTSLEWSAYKGQFNKSYTNYTEEERHFKNFLTALRRIESYNQAHASASSYKKGLSHLSDWDADQLAQLMGVRKQDTDFANKLSGNQQADTTFKQSTISKDKLRKLLELDTIPVPTQIDWRSFKGRVSGVKTQGECGSCWAFATTGLLEGQQKKRIFTLLMIPLSEQDLLDCSPSNRGCGGGHVAKALQDIQWKRGIQSDHDYPYEGKQGICTFNKNYTVMTTAGFILVPPNDEDLLKQVVGTYGPVAVNIEATKNLEDYQTGVFVDQDCKRDDEVATNHAVLIVGYGTDHLFGDYWLIKNSWGSDWGEKGYVRMRRGSNMCGVATEAVIAKF